MYHYNEFTPKINTYCFFKLSSRRIKSDDIGIEVVLIDYNNLEAFIPITEINRKKFNIATFFKPETIYPGIVYLIDNKRIMISYSKIKEEKRDNLLKTFEIQTKICKMISTIKTKHPNSVIINPVYIDFTDGNYDDLEKIFINIILNPDEITSDDIVKKYIIDNRNIQKPIYEQYFTLTIIEINGLQVLKNILAKINKEYKIKIISSPLYCVEFNDITQVNKIKQFIEETVKDIECLFEIKELLTLKQLRVDF
jgi:translation initiation factor 2 alpha subunit (eIF-2alpha)